MPVDVSKLVASFDSLDNWVEMQRKAKELFAEVNEGIEDADRLALVLAIRQAFQHMIKTLRAFDNWLEDPVILNYVTREMLLEVWETTYEILDKLLDLDIRHTSALKKVAQEEINKGKLPPLMDVRKESEEEPKGTLRPL